MAKFCNLVRSSPFYNTSLVVVCIDVSSTDLYKIQRIFSNHRMIIGDSIYFEKFENDIRNEVIQFYKKERN
jgi:hypothetical protein